MVFVSDVSSGSDLLQATLREIAGDRDLHLLNDQEEALELIEREQSGVVFSYLASGALASTFFLNEVWKKNPKSARFVVDNAADGEALVRCVLGGHQFLQTPVDTQTVRTALQHHDNLQRFLRNERTESVMPRMRTLPPRPSVYADVMREIRSPSASATVVADLVAKDLAVSTKLIQLVNSSYYSVAEPLSDIRDAVLYLGLDATVSVVLSIETFARFDKVKPLYFSVDRVWKHSQVVSDLAKRLTLLLTNESQAGAHAYLAGLLHDVGELVFAANFGDDYHRAINLAEKEKRPLYSVELDLFKATHADAGACLLALWGLPLPVVEAVAYHHLAPELLGGDFSPAHALHLAEKVIESPEALEDLLDGYSPEVGWDSKIEEIKALLPSSVRHHKPTSPQRSFVERAPLGKVSDELSATRTKAPRRGIAKFLNW